MRKRQIWKLHSWLGLLTGVPLILIALSGSILVFKPEIDALLTPDRMRLEANGQARLSLDVLHQQIIKQLPDHVLVGWSLPDAPTRSDEIYIIKKGDNEWKRAYLNGFNGALLSKPLSLQAGLTEWLLMLHYTFLGGHLGMLIVGILAVGLCLLGISGIYIYRRFWIKFFTLKWGKGSRVFTGDLHRKLGMISSPVFLILGLTGAYWNITHAAADLYQHGLGDEQAVLKNSFTPSTTSIDRMMVLAEKEKPGYRPLYIAFPQSEEGVVSFYGQLEGASSLRSPYGVVVYFHRETGQLEGQSDIRDAGLIQQSIDAFYPLHYGTFGGLFSRIIWCVLGLAPGLLSLTGFYVYVARRKKRKNRGGR